MNLRWRTARSTVSSPKYSILTRPFEFIFRNILIKFIFYFHSNSLNHQSISTRIHHTYFRISFAKFSVKTDKVNFSMAITISDYNRRENLCFLDFIFGFKERFSQLFSFRWPFLFWFNFYFLYFGDFLASNFCSKFPNTNAVNFISILFSNFLLIFIFFCFLYDRLDS